MATRYSPKIVTDNLILCLDAASSRSYPGSGSTWKNLSGNISHDGTITGATFVPQNFGFLYGSTAGVAQFDFDGNSDYVGPNTFDYDDSGGQFTVCAWVNPDDFDPSTGSNSYQAIINRSDNSSHTFSVFINTTSSGNTTGDMASWIADTGASVRQHHADGACVLNLNEWNFCVWRFIDGSGYTYDLFNSEGHVTKDASSAYTMRKDSTSQYTIGGWRGGNYHFDGGIGLVHVYKKRLTNAEVLKNYEAQKGRYNG